jgi:hypothetical protein
MTAKNERDERAAELTGDNRAQLDDLGFDPGQVGPASAGQSGDSQDLSQIADMNEESVEELADTEQAYEAAAVKGVEDAADHPERPLHAHEEYRKSDDFGSTRGEEEKAA